MWWSKDKETTKFPYHQINTKEMKSCVESNVVFVSFGTLPNWWLLTIKSVAKFHNNPNLLVELFRNPFTLWPLVGASNINMFFFPSFAK